MYVTEVNDFQESTSPPQNPWQIKQSPQIQSQGSVLQVKDPKMVSAGQERVSLTESLLIWTVMVIA